MKPFYKTILLLFLNAPFLSFNSFSQQAPGIEWQKCLGGIKEDWAANIWQTSDSGYIVAAITYSNDGDVSGNHDSTLQLSDWWIAKLDHDGNIQWQKCLGGTSADQPNSVRQTTDGGYIVAGGAISNDGDVSGNHGNGDVWIVKLDSSGNIEWQKCFGGTEGEEAKSIRQTSDGGYISVAYTYSNDGDVSGNHGTVGLTTDYWIIKLDSIGNLQWQKCLGGTYVEMASDIKQTSDGGYIVSGFANSNNGDISNNHGWNDNWIVKLDTSGNIQWQNCFGGTGNDQSYSILQTADGGYLSAGIADTNNGDVLGNHGKKDYWIIKMDSIGNLQWQKCLGGSSDDYAKSVCQTSDGAFVVNGNTWSHNGDVTGNHGVNDYWVVKLDSIGNLLWQKCLGGNTGDMGVSIQQTFDQGFILTGSTISNDGDVSGNHDTIYPHTSDIWVVKLLPDTITSIPNFKPQTSNFKLFPNPSSGIFTITFPSSSNQKTNYTLEVINTLGQIVFTSPPAPLQRRGESSALSLDLSFLPKGMYVLKINDGVSALSRKFVIE